MIMKLLMNDEYLIMTGNAMKCRNSTMLPAFIVKFIHKVAIPFIYFIVE